MKDEGRAAVGRNKLAQFRQISDTFMPELRMLVPAYKLRSKN
jgi:hypothetical protein